MVSGRGAPLLRNHVLFSRSIRILGLLSLLGSALVVGCYDLEGLAPSVRPDIDEDGVIYSEELKVRGQWYVYGDAYGKPQACMDVGKHLQEDCSKVGYPTVHVPELEFPNLQGRMCVSGVVAQVLACCTEESGDDGNAPRCSGENETNCFDKNILDHSSMWGAGIGFDFDLNLLEGETRNYDLIHARVPWNASEHRVIGVAFDMQWHSSESEIPLRVEFPIEITDPVLLPPDKGSILLGEGDVLEEIPPGGTMPANSSTEEHPYGSPFWQREGESEWKRSPVHQGRNVILWENVFAPPEDEYGYWDNGIFNGEGLLGVQFHVIPENEGKSDVEFSFCISNLVFLTEK